MTASAAAAARLRALLDAAEVESYAAYEDGEDWRVELLVAGLPDPAAVAGFADMVRAAGIPGERVVVAPLPAADWLAENRRDFAPLRIGRVVVRSAESPRPPRDGRIDLVLEAGPAFGTGRHATTALCLEAIERLARRHRAARVLDLGCGAGILALAAARTWPARVIAADIDPVAVRVARENARRNRLGGRVRVVRSSGLRAVPGRYDLVLANILAGPLMEMAGGIARALRPGGLAVLSGLLANEERRVLARARAHGLVPLERRRREGWSALVLRRP